jgi:hypothetical protein
MKTTAPPRPAAAAPVAVTLHHLRRTALLSKLAASGHEGINGKDGGVKADVEDDAVAGTTT